MKRTWRKEDIFALKNKSDKAKNVLIEYPFDSEIKLVAPAAPTERTANLYRFALAIPAGKTGTLRVAVERPLSETVSLVDIDVNTLAAYVKGGAVSSSLRAALQEVMRRRALIDEKNRQANDRQAQITALGLEQDRIRRNMAALDRGSALYKRYVGELDQQETRIQNLQTQITRLRAEAAEASASLRAYLDTLEA